MAAVRQQQPLITEAVVFEALEKIQRERVRALAAPGGRGAGLPARWAQGGGLALEALEKIQQERVGAGLWLARADGRAVGSSAAPARGTAGRGRGARVPASCRRCRAACCAPRRPPAPGPHAGSRALPRARPPTHPPHPTPPSRSAPCPSPPSRRATWCRPPCAAPSRVRLLPLAAPRDPARPGLGAEQAWPRASQSGGPAAGLQARALLAPAGTLAGARSARCCCAAPHPTPLRRSVRGGARHRGLPHPRV